MRKWLVGFGCDRAKPRGNYRGTEMKIAYLGPKGSFSHHVVQTAFPHEELQAFANITDVIKAYEQGLVDYSVVPVENSIEGSVHETLDYLFIRLAFKQWQKSFSLFISS